MKGSGGYDDAYCEDSIPETQLVTESHCDDEHPNVLIDLTWIR